MGDNTYTSLPSDVSGERKHPISLIARLMRDAAGMQHADEVFLWLSQAIVEHLDIAVVQFWALQQDTQKQFHAEIRAAYSKNSALPQQVHVNAHVVSIIARLLLEQRGISSLASKNIFPDPQVSQLAFYNLNFWAGYFLKHEAYLPPVRTKSSSTQVATPLTMIISFFTQIPFTKEQERAINYIVEQALRILINRKLLAPHVTVVAENGRNHSDKKHFQFIADLIPRRAQNLEEEQANNPFASAPIIENKDARHLYAAINDRRKISELAQMTRIEQKELLVALRYLLHQQRIHLYTPEGQKIDESLFDATSR